MQKLIEQKVVFDTIDRSLWCFFCVRMNLMNNFVTACGFMLCVLSRGYVSPVLLVLAMQYVRGLSSHIMWFLQHIGWISDQIIKIQNFFDLMEVVQEKDTCEIEVDQ